MMNSVQGILLLLVCDVIGAVNDEVKSMSVYEGESVTLHTDTNLLEKDKILWRFEEKGSFILLFEMSNYNIKYEDSIDVRLRDRLQISDTQRGDLTIKNMRVKYSGLYRAEINTKTASPKKTFNVTVKESPRVTDVGASDVKSESVKEGESVTLHTDEQTQKGDLIQWRFGDKNLLIAKGDMEDNKISVYDDDDGRFSGRLKLNDQTGDLTITNIITSNAGVYNLKIISSRETKYKTFSVSLSGGGLSRYYIVVIICILFIAALVAALVALWYRRRSSQLKEIIVEEGESVTLSTADIKGFIFRDAVIEWMYGDKGIIAEINTNNNTKTTPDERYQSRLELNNKTGDLIINNLKTKHSGLYKLKITSSKGWPFSMLGASYYQFNVIVTERIEHVKYGDSVTLHTAVKGLRAGDEILWMCGAENIHIVKFTVGTEGPVLYPYTDDRYNDRLHINPQTGDLTIKDITPKHCGLYRVQICTNQRSTYRRFKVSILVPAEKGGSVGLMTGAQIQRGDRVEWSFRDDPLKRTSYDKITLVTGVNGDSNKTSYTDDERFRDRLKMNAQTGDLFITDIRETDEGVYTLQQHSTGGKITNWVFSVVFDSARTYRNDPGVDIPLLKKV
nr:uncharacterized protein LOC129453851 [Misgurnus anguillicaudatus]